MWASDEGRAKFMAKDEEKRIAAVRAAMKRPEVNEKMRLAQSNPEVNARRGAKISAAFATSEVKARHKAGLATGKPKLIAGLKAYYADPANREKAREAQFKVREQHSAALKVSWAHRKAAKLVAE